MAELGTDTRPPPSTEVEDSKDIPFRGCQKSSVKALLMAESLAQPFTDLLAQFTAGSHSCATNILVHSGYAQLALGLESSHGLGTLLEKD